MFKEVKKAGRTSNNLSTINTAKFLPNKVSTVPISTSRYVVIPKQAC